MPAAVSAFRDVFRVWSEDRVTYLAAALAYYAAFALAPLVLIVLQIAGFALGSNEQRAVREDILAALQPSLGPGATASLDQVMRATAAQHAQGTVAATIGWIVFLIAATGLFVMIEDSFNLIWHVQRKNAGWLVVLRERAVSLLAIAGISLLLLLAFVFNAGVVALRGTLAALVPFWGGAGVMLEIALSVVILVLLFTAMYAYLPRTRVRISHALVGGAVAAVGFLIGQYVIGWYLGRAATTSAYGAAGSFVALLLWLYYSGQILLFGAVLARVLGERSAQRHGERRAAVRGTEPLGHERVSHRFLH